MLKPLDNLKGKNLPILMKREKFNQEERKVWKTLARHFLATNFGWQCSFDSMTSASGKFNCSDTLTQEKYNIIINVHKTAYL